MNYITWKSPVCGYPIVLFIPIMQDGICRGEQKVNCPKGKRGHPGVLLVRAEGCYKFIDSQWAACICYFAAWWTVLQKYGFPCFFPNAEITGKVRYCPGIINGSCWSRMHKNTGMNRLDPNNLKIHRFKTKYQQSNSQPDSSIPPAIKCNPDEWPMQHSCIRGLDHPGLLI